MNIFHSLCRSLKSGIGYGCLKLERFVRSDTFVSSNPWDEFQYAVDLDVAGKYWMFWTPDEETKTITFEVNNSYRSHLQLQSKLSQNNITLFHELISFLLQSIVFFQVHVEALGYVGFGLSPNGGMPGSDVVIGWVTDDGTAVFYVCEAPSLFTEI